MDNQTVRIDNETYFKLVVQELEAGNEVRIPVIGRSMEPFLRERDEVLLHTAKIADITVGDIVLARWKQRYVLHRVVRKNADGLWLVGDNNLAQIEKIAATDLVAVLFEARRGGKLLPVSSTFNKNLGMLWYHLRFPRRVVVAVKRRLLKAPTDYK